MAQWEGRLTRLKDKQRGIAYQKKTPATWPFCLGCHLAAPETKHAPRCPELAQWGIFEVRNSYGDVERHHVCPNCTAALALKLTQININTTAKLKEIAVMEARKAGGLLPKLKLMVKYPGNRISHAEDCQYVTTDGEWQCTCGAVRHVK